MSVKYYDLNIKVSDVKFIKYRRVSKFPALYRYLDIHFAGWRWGNVFYKGSQIGSFTTKNRKTTF